MIRVNHVHDDVFISSDYTTLNDKIMNDKLIEKDLVKSHRDVMRGHIGHLPGGTEENTKNVCDRQSQVWHLRSSEWETGGRIYSRLSAFLLTCMISSHFGAPFVGILWGKNYFM